MTINIAALAIAILDAAVCNFVHTSHELWSLKYEQQARELRAMHSPPKPETDVYSPHEIAYIERTLKQVIAELKKSSYIRQDFRFNTKAERYAHVEKVIDDFLNE